MSRIDELNTDKPFYDSRKMVSVLAREGYFVKHKRIE